MGFHEVSKEGYVHQAGDVRVFQNIPGRKHGHIDMWDGTHWYSDFKEGKFPGPKYRVIPYRIYRR